jgi:hypothetical protein
MFLFPTCAVFSNLCEQYKWHKPQDIPQQGRMKADQNKPPIFHNLFANIDAVLVDITQPNPLAAL